MIAAAPAVAGMGAANAFDPFLFAADQKDRHSDENSGNDRQNQNVDRFHRITSLPTGNARPYRVGLAVTLDTQVDQHGSEQGHQ